MHIIYTLWKQLLRSQNPCHPAPPAPPLRPGHWPHGRLGEPHPRPPHRCHAHALPRCPGAEGAPVTIFNGKNMEKYGNITILNG